MVNLSTQLISLLAAAAFVTTAPTTPNTPTHDILQARNVDCRDDLPPGSIGRTTDAVKCINNLANRGNAPCTGTVSAQVFCRHGQTQITGITARKDQTGDLSTCRSGGWKDSGSLLERGWEWRGVNQAIGNPRLLVDIRRVVQGSNGLETGVDACW